VIERPGRLGESVRVERDHVGVGVPANLREVGPERLPVSALLVHLDAVHLAEAAAVAVRVSGGVGAVRDGVEHMGLFRHVVHLHRGDDEPPGLLVVSHHRVEEAGERAGRPAAGVQEELSQVLLGGPRPSLVEDGNRLVHDFHDVVWAGRRVRVRRFDPGVGLVGEGVEPRELNQLVQTQQHPVFQRFDTGPASRPAPTNPLVRASPDQARTGIDEARPPSRTAGHANRCKLAYHDVPPWGVSRP
jgi:hypothetical protein